MVASHALYLAQQLRTHYPITLLGVIMSTVMTGAVGFGVRMALKEPDVGFRRRTDGSLPNEDYRDKQFQMIDPFKDPHVTRAPRY